MNRAKILGMAGIFLWLSCIPRLFPLPPDEVALNVEILEKSLAESTEVLSEQYNEPEWKHEMQQYISTAKDHEKLLWVKWFSYLALIFVAIVGWLLTALTKRISKWIILTTTVLLVSSSLLFDFIVYQGFLRAIVDGSIRFIPWGIITSTTYYNFILPLLLIALSINLFKVRSDNAT